MKVDEKNGEMTKIDFFLFNFWKLPKKKPELKKKILILLPLCTDKKPDSVQSCSSQQHIIMKNDEHTRITCCTASILEYMNMNNK